jgi:alkanesulfonate monooxygenase SsuD/methylene tetrahydromethanopterin reductase-like flavin-dependent oxidoreductase (luciferase family)
MAYVQIRYECRAPAGVSPMSLDEVYETTLEQIAWIDAQGFPVTVNFSEHHGAEDGYLPSPITMAAAAAAITRHVRLQVNVVLPFRDPLQVAEEAAVLDRISRGRAELLLMGGFVPAEMETFGVDPKQRGELMEEGVRVLRQAWSGEPFDYRGRRCQILPRPVQQPHPPLFMGAATPVAARRAARIADGFIAVSWLNEHYRAECAAVGRTPRYQGEMPFSYLYVCENPDRTWERLAPYCLYETNMYARWQASASQSGMFKPATDTDALRALKIYQPVTAAEVLARAPSLAPNDALVLHPLISGLEKDLSWEGLRLFFTEVAPHLDIRGL